MHQFRPSALFCCCCYTRYYPARIHHLLITFITSLFSCDCCRWALSALLLCVYIKSALLPVYTSVLLLHDNICCLVAKLSSYVPYRSVIRNNNINYDET
jgi:hypothetical protein